MTVAPVTTVAQPAGPAEAAEPAGLYVHVPFCLTRCGYCDFNTYAGLGHLAGRYVRALAAEADLAGSAWAGVPFASVFFGGGTPTTLDPADLMGLVAGFRRAFMVQAGAEITIEANPDTVDERSLAELRTGGVNRLSMGAQSFDPGVLDTLERVHAPSSVRRAFAAARLAGFDNVNLDFIYGAEGESLASWEATLDQALELGPEHLSCYALTIEPATALGRRVQAGLARAPDPDLQAAMFERACRALASAGFEHYEVSNWALPGFRSRHNTGYWEGRPYLGLGAGAHSFKDPRRWWNVRPPQQYVREVEGGRIPVGGEERLSPPERRLERLLLGLRASGGVPLSWVDGERAAAFVDQGLAIRRGGLVALSERGMFLANELVAELAG